MKYVLILYLFSIIDSLFFYKFSQNLGKYDLGKN